MAKRNKYHKIEASDLYNYFEGKLSNKEKNTFERQLEKDLFESDAAEGLSMLTREEAEQDLSILSGKIKHRTNRSRRIGWYSAAAAIASILVVTTIFINLADSSKDKLESAPWMKEASKEGHKGEQKRVQREVQKGVQKEADSQEKLDEVLAEDKSSEGEIAKEKEAATLQPEVSIPEPIEDQEMVLEEMESVEEENNYGFTLDDENEISQEEVSTVVAAAKDNAEQAQGIEEVIVSEPAATPLSYQDIQVSRDENAFQKIQAAESSRRIKKVSNTSMKSAKGSTGVIAGAPLDEITGRISGVIRSANDLEPIPGVSVVVKGTGMGTVTDDKGAFALSAADSGEEILVASFIGMEPEEFIAQVNQPMEIAMMPSSMELDEVVVVGYATKSYETTGAVTKVKIEDPEAPTYSSPSPERGIISYRRYIDTSLVYPPISEEETTKAVVVLKFSISPNGRPQRFTVVKTPSPLFSDEAIRVIESGPDWIPATRNEEYFDEEVRLRVVFK